jgi:rare lipoprotein A
VEVRTLDAAPLPVPAPETPITAADSAPVAAPLTASPLEAASPAAAVAGAQVVQVPVPSALFIQAGAFSDPKNAERQVEKLRGGGYGKIFVRDDEIAGRRMYRVRIGPVPSVAEFDRIVAALERVGIKDAHLALD